MGTGTSEDPEELVAEAEELVAELDAELDCDEEDTTLFEPPVKGNMPEKLSASP